MPEAEVVPDTRGDAVDSHLVREEQRQIVREAIAALPPAQKAAVLLRDVEGLSYEEISQTLGIPRGTVMSRIHYGRANLKQALQGLLGPRAEKIKFARQGGDA